MKNIRLLFLAIFSLTSCDKATEIAETLKTKITDEISSTRDEATPDEVDPTLLALVDETDDGVIFRRDLPFPRDLEVRETINMELRNVRAMTQSQLGSQSATLNQKHSIVTCYNLQEDRLRTTLKTHQISEASGTDGAESESEPISASVDVGLEGGYVDFIHKDGAWAAVRTQDFRRMMWQRNLLENLDGLLTASAVRPRPLWFSGNRIRPGETLRLDNELMPVMIDGKARGKIELTLIGVEPVFGHPCGLFSIKGNYTAKDIPKPDGSRVSENVTIESGKIWMSLLYPVILQSEVETIQTLRISTAGGPSQHVQGGAFIKITREWRPGHGGFE